MKNAFLRLFFRYFELSDDASRSDKLKLNRIKIDHYGHKIQERRSLIPIIVFYERSVPLTGIQPSETHLKDRMSICLS